jgi:hypothetical protein
MTFCTLYYTMPRRRENINLHEEMGRSGQDTNPQHYCSTIMDRPRRCWSPFKWAHFDLGPHTSQPLPVRMSVAPPSIVAMSD